VVVVVAITIFQFCVRFSLVTEAWRGLDKHQSRDQTDT
jgi:hypothetical protein